MVGVFESDARTGFDADILVKDRATDASVGANYNSRHQDGLNHFGCSMDTNFLGYHGIGFSQTVSARKCIQPFHIGFVV